MRAALIPANGCTRTFQLAPLRRRGLALFWLAAGLGFAQTTALLPSTDFPDAKARLDRYVYRTYSWQRLSLLGLDTLVDGAIAKPQWGRGLSGFSCHYASRFGRRFVGNSIEFGLAETLHQDTRYRRSSLQGRSERVRYAFTQAFVAHRADGRTELAYARFGGLAGRAMISPLWRNRPVSANCVLRDVGFGLFDQVQNNLLTEFTPDLKRFGRHLYQRVLSR